MLSAIFDGQRDFIVGASIFSMVSFVVCFVVARRAGGRAWSWAAFGGAVAAEVSLTLLFTGGGGASGQCVINKDLAEPFATEQGVLNAALFVPIGLFGVLAARAVVPVLVGGVLLSAATELLQALVPGIGRDCDSSDLEMNSMGVVAGVVVAWTLILLVRRTIEPLSAGVRATSTGSAVALLAAGMAWYFGITPLVMEATSIQVAGSKEKRAAEEVIRQTFGDRYGVANVQVMPGTYGGGDRLLIALEKGSAELSWPDREQLSVELEHSSTPSDASFPVPGVSVRPRDKGEALVVAETFARKTFPWGVAKSGVEVYPVGEKAELGWIASWRRRVNGVLMPMRLDVQVNRAGRISQILARHVDDPVRLPRVLIKESDAVDIVRRAQHQPAGAVKTGRGELLAIKRQGEWRAQWLIPYRIKDQTGRAYVDATTGEVDDSASPQQSLRAERTGGS
ncbi:VanZ family protein [Streptomyces sp. AV19]|uniref:VanZ family protein n=1 Tax=Streptomyces sp. AV19 TaxID=2793068 RepID=UPI0018FEA963|nr:VanZ family protein [Streptomyces sp. AV19]MBH1933762.1 VanZ family protein [Streptomyces sp. AV19]MDG4535734.1 VanZ family protein [Streptomyces sp. AV19]